MTARHVYLARTTDAKVQIAQALAHRTPGDTVIVHDHPYATPCGEADCNQEATE